MLAVTSRCKASRPYSKVATAELAEHYLPSFCYNLVNLFATAANRAFSESSTPPKSGRSRVIRITFYSPPRPLGSLFTPGSLPVHRSTRRRMHCTRNLNASLIGSPSSHVELRPGGVIARQPSAQPIETPKEHALGNVCLIKHDPLVQAGRFEEESKRRSVRIEPVERGQRICSAIQYFCGEYCRGFA
jgi:hypothetical protein